MRLRGVVRLLQVAGQLATGQLDAAVTQIVLAGALGLFLGLECEWSHKLAGIRTFSLISLLGAAFTVLGSVPLVVLGGVLVGAIVPLGSVTVGRVAIAALTADWQEPVEMELESPFSLSYVLGFGGLTLLVVVVGGLAADQFGTVGFYVTAALTGLVSSAGATTSTVVLYRGGDLSADAAVLAILLATAASILVKAGLTFARPDRRFAGRVAAYSTVLLVAAGTVTAAATV